MVVGGGPAAIVTSTDLNTWTPQDSGVDGDLYDVTFGNGTFVAVGGGNFGWVCTSTDGETWVAQQPTDIYNLWAVTYSNGIFVAGGNGKGSGKILTSPDGATWTNKYAGGPYELYYGATWANGTFVVVGSEGKVLTSPDGDTWTLQSSGTTLFLHGIIFGNSAFVVVGGYGYIGTSADSITWTSISSGFYVSSNGMASGNGLFVAVGEPGGSVLTSPEGITWTSRDSKTTFPLYGVTWGSEGFVAVGFGGTIITSPDGVTWTLKSGATSWELYGVTYGNGMYIICGEWGTILTSPNGVTWTPRDSKTNHTLYGITWGNEGFVAVGGGGTVVTSPDGVTWTLKTSDPSKTLYAVTYGNGMYLACGSGIILTSPDGGEWTPRDSGIIFPLYGVAWGSEGFVAVGGGGTILTSSDGTIWESIFPLTSNSLRGITYSTGAHGASTIVTGGDWGTILQSDPLHLSATPSLLDFGVLDVGSISAPMTLSISNIGIDDLFIESILLAGPDDEDFLLQGDLCKGMTLVPTGNCTVVVAFSPKSRGSKSAYITVSYNAPDAGTFDVPLRGVGLEPDISVTPASVEFGNIPVRSSASSVVTVSNQGTIDLVIGTLTLAGIDASEFSIQNDNCSGHALAPSYSCSVEIVFSPISTGSKSATLGIPSNDPDTPTMDVSLSGIGISPYSKLTVLFPNGGDMIASGSMCVVRWGSPLETAKFRLQYSVNNGVTWKTMADNLSVTSYNWTVPIPIGNKKACLIKVIGYNASNMRIGADKSDAPFRIEVVSVTSPQDGDLLVSGETQRIIWRTNGTKEPVAGVRLHYTKDGGSTWLPIATAITGNPGYYDWTPSVGAMQRKCKVKVILKSASIDTVGSDVSEGFFSIQP
jgi:hypothetical protein